MIVNHHHKEPRHEAGALGWQVIGSVENSPEQTKALGYTPETSFVPTTKKEPQLKLRLKRKRRDYLS